MTLIRLRGVTKTYPPARKGAEPVIAVDDVDLDVAAGEVCGIVGYSGAGKSTVLRLVNALEKPTSGSVEVDGADITRFGERELRALRGDIGMIFQQFDLFDSRTVAGNVAYPLEVARRPKGEITARVAELLEFVGLSGKAGSHPSSSPAGRSSASASHGRWRRTRASCSPTRRRARSILTPRRRSSRCCAGSTASWV